jgi:hypothetical protein
MPITVLKLIFSALCPLLLIVGRQYYFEFLFCARPNKYGSCQLLCLQMCYGREFDERSFYNSSLYLSDS